MTKDVFEKLFNNIVGRNKFKVMEGQSPEYNIRQFQKFAFLEHNCRFLYKALSNLYGEDYGEKIITDVINEKLIISNPENFTYKNKLYVKDTLFAIDFITTYNGKTNLISALGELSFILNNHGKYVNNLISPDILIIISMYIHKFMTNKALKYAVFQGKAQKHVYLQTLLKAFLRTISTKKGEENKITLGILDRKTFDYLIANKDYSIHWADLNMSDKPDVMKPSYANYIKALKLFIKACSVLKGITLPNLVYYIYPTKNIKELVIAKLAEYLEIQPMFVGLNLRGLYVGKETDFNSPEYERGFSNLVKRTKKDLSVEDLKNISIQIINEDVSNSADRTNLENLPLIKFMKKYRQQAKPYLLLYDRRDYKDVFKPKVSEVSIDFSKIQDELLTVSELMQKLVETYIDAQAINQTRLSFIKTDKYTDCRCNVIIKNVDDTLIPTVFNELEQQTKFLKSTYGVDFTFEIENKYNF